MLCIQKVGFDLVFKKRFCFHRKKYRNLNSFRYAGRTTITEVTETSAISCVDLKPSLAIGSHHLDLSGVERSSLAYFFQHLLLLKIWEYVSGNFTVIFKTLGHCFQGEKRFGNFSWSKREVSLEIVYFHNIEGTCSSSANIYYEIETAYAVLYPQTVFR